MKTTETRWRLSPKCLHEIQHSSKLREKRVTLIFLYFTSPGVRGWASESRALQLRSPKCASYSHTWNDKRGEKIFIAVIYDLATRSVVDSCATWRGVSSTRLGDFSLQIQLSNKTRHILSPWLCFNGIELKAATWNPKPTRRDSTLFN